jgi:hypothetical protein
MEAREAELLPVPYFHVVFTLPQQLGALALQNAREIYSILFRAAAETLITISADPKRLGAAVGFLAVLHTWGQNLHLHPHLHCVVPGGGISPGGAKWIGCRKPSFLLPTGVLRSRFRNVFLKYLREAFDEGRLQFHGDLAGLGKPSAFAALCNRMKRIKWNVYVKPPFGGPERVLKYLARYTHRVAISNSRILSIADGKVTFLWKDYADGDKVKPMTLEAVEFIRRFLLHILPAGFVRIRQFGFLANRARRNKLALCRTLLGAPSAPPRSALADVRDRKTDEKLCPVCRTGHMILIRLAYTERLAALPIRIDSS